MNKPNIISIESRRGGPSVEFKESVDRRLSIISEACQLAIAAIEGEVSRNAAIKRTPEQIITEPVYDQVASLQAAKQSASEAYAQIPKDQIDQDLEALGYGRTYVPQTDLKDAA